MKALITGVAGFIGSHLADRLLSEGFEIIGVDNLYSGTVYNLLKAKKSKKFSFFKLDIRNKLKLTKISKDINFIFHQAAITEIPFSFKNPELVHDVNVNGTLNILDISRKTDSKLVFASSSSVYGYPENIPIKEEHTTNPVTPYGLTKLISEKYCELFSKLYGTQIVSLRYFNVYGPRQNIKSHYSGVIAAFIKNILNNLSPVIYGDGKQVRDFIFVEDVVEANYLAGINNVNGVFNVGTGVATSIIDLANIISEIVVKKIKPRFSRGRPHDIKISVADTSKIEMELKFKPKISLYEGLIRTIDYFKQVI
ncbi:MAG: GDP-mannose 4,6-dehydratase [Candidatus Aenigmatarchaeota archaeon]